MSDFYINVRICSNTSSEGFPNVSQEKLLSIFCGKMIESTQDAIMQSVFFPPISYLIPSLTNVTATQIPKTKHEIILSEEGILAYQEVLSNKDPVLQADSTDELLAFLHFDVTKHNLTSAAKNTN